jgi:hypothetical protein
MTPQRDWSLVWNALGALGQCLQAVLLAAIWWWGDRLAARLAERRNIEFGLTRLADLALQYPIVETERLRSYFHELQEDDLERIRYENYAVIVCNTLESIYDFEQRWGKAHNGNAEELVRLHWQWFAKEEENRKTIHRSGFGDWILSKRGH